MSIYTRIHQWTREIPRETEARSLGKGTPVKLPTKIRVRSSRQLGWKFLKNIQILAKKHQSHPDWNTDGCITMPSYESPHSWWHPHIWRHRWWSSFRRSKLRLLFHERGRRQPTPSYKPTHFRANWRTTAEASSLAKKVALSSTDSWGVFFSKKISQSFVVLFSEFLHLFFTCRFPIKTNHTELDFFGRNWPPVELGKQKSRNNWSRLKHLDKEMKREKKSVMKYRWSMKYTF